MNAKTDYIFAKSIYNGPDHQYDFRVYPDGTRAVNVWHYDDGTSAEGVDILVDDFIAEYGNRHACEMAWRDYLDNTTLAGNERPATTPNNPHTLVSNSAGVSVHPGSPIAEDWDYQTNYAVAQAAIRYEAEVTALVLKQLSARGIQLYHLATKSGNRWQAAWELLERGEYELTGLPNTALKVKSHDPRHPQHYQVWTNAQGRQCDCADHAQREQQHGGFCKHVILLEIIQAAAVAYRLNNPVPATAPANLSNVALLPTRGIGRTRKEVLSA